jgi:hypothetical protein
MRNSIVYSSPDITRVIKSRRVRWMVHREMRNVYTILAVKSEGKRPLRIPRHRWEDNIKINIREIGFGGVVGLIWLGKGTGIRLLRTW